MISRSVFRSLPKQSPFLSLASKSLKQPSVFTIGSERFASVKADALNSPTATDIPVIPANRWEGSRHWYGERALSVALVPMFCISGFYGGHPINDMALGILLPIHTHIGLSAVVTDYIPYRRLPAINRIVTVTQLILTGTAFYGCYVINTEGEGLTEYFKKLWKA